MEKMQANSTLFYTLYIYVYLHYSFGFVKKIVTKG